MFAVKSEIPKSLGYRFPAEWEKHDATWLSYPHNEVSWPGKIHAIFPYYHQFIKEIASGETVNINVLNGDMEKQVHTELRNYGVDMGNIRLHLHPTNDAWCRDHGPAFLTSKVSQEPKAVINWKYNGWGNKYPAELYPDPIGNRQA